MNAYVPAYCKVCGGELHSKSSKKKGYHRKCQWNGNPPSPYIVRRAEG